MEGERRGNLELEGELVERGAHGDGVRRSIPLKLSSHHSKRTASVRDDRGASSEKHHSPMKWDVKLNLIGKKINDTMLHLCEKCVCPVNLYGRMIPCKHVFCFDCSKRTDKNCLRCGDPVQRIEQCPRGAVFMCTFGDGKHGNKGCRRTYLSQRDLQAHINHRHKRPVVAEPAPHQAYPTSYQPYPTPQDQGTAVYRPVPTDQYAPPPPPPPPQAVPQGMGMTHGAPLQPPPEHRDYSRMPPHHSIPPPGHPHDDRMHEPPPPPHPIPPPQHYQDPLTGHATTGPPHPDHLPPPPPPPPPEHHRYPPSSDSLPNPVSQSYMPVTSSRSSNLITVPIKDDGDDLAKQGPASTQTPHNQGTMYRPIHQGAAPAVPIPYSAPPPHGHVGQPVHSGPPVVRGPGYDSHGRPYDESAISPPFAQPGGHSPRAAWPLAGPPPRGPAPVPQGPMPGGMPSASSASSSNMPPQAAHGHPPRTSYYN